MVKDTEGLQKHFSAYVKKAVQNNSYKYFSKKKKVTDAETAYENYEDLPKLEIEDILQQIDKISESFVEGVSEIKLLLDQIEDYNLFVTITEMPDIHKNVISLRIFHEKTFYEIGEILGITEKKAENTYYNAIKKIRKMMEEKAYEL